MDDEDEDEIVTGIDEGLHSQARDECVAHCAGIALVSLDAVRGLLKLNKMPVYEREAFEESLQKTFGLLVDQISARVNKFSQEALDQHESFQKARVRCLCLVSPRLCTAGEGKGCMLSPREGLRPLL